MSAAGKWVGDEHGRRLDEGPGGRKLSSPNATDRVIDLVERLPARTYENVADVWQALTGTSVEQRF